MPEVLIVEDDAFKAEDLRAVLFAVDQSTKCHIVASVSGAVEAIKTHIFDLILLDMALPSHSLLPGGGAPLSMLTGGTEVLFELQSMGRYDPCIVITQYPEIEMCGRFYSVAASKEAFAAEYEVTVLACLEYSERNPAWKRHLLSLYKNICES